MKRLTLAFVVVVGLCFSAEAQKLDKLSPYLTGLVRSESVEKSGVTTLATLAVPCDAELFFLRHGCRLIDSIGRIYIVQMPLGRVVALSDNDTVERIEAERMPRLSMDVTPQQVNAEGIYSGAGLPQAFTGSGVAAGVFDAYYDFTHPAFLDANGKCHLRTIAIE